MSRPRCTSCGKSVKNTGPPRDEPRLCGRCRDERKRLVAAILSAFENSNPVSP